MRTGVPCCSTMWSEMMAGSLTAASSAEAAAASAPAAANQTSHLAILDMRTSERVTLDSTVGCVGEGLWGTEPAGPWRQVASLWRDGTPPAAPGGQPQTWAGSRRRLKRT